MQVIVPELIKHVFTKRPDNSHKGDYGKVLVIANEYVGAPALVAMAALRTGCDVVKIYAPEKIINPLSSFSPNLIVIPFKGNRITKNHLLEMLNLSDNFDAVAIGSGLGNVDILAIKAFLSEVTTPCIVDAEAIKACRGIKNENLLLTPHATEFKEFSGESVSESLEKRMLQVEKYAHRFGAILLKGNTDIISNGIKTALNKTGNPYMTVGGTGDVLAGICASLIAQGNEVFISACAGAFISGSAGDIAAERYGPGMLATDVINFIPEIIKKIEKT